MEKDKEKIIPPGLVSIEPEEVVEVIEPTDHIELSKAQQEKETEFEGKLDALLGNLKDTQ